MRSVVQDLAIWGPTTTPQAVSLAEAQRYCRELATTHFENFPVVSWLLPKRLHQHFYNVYAYCRWADDLGDEVEGAERSLSLLSWWRGELQRCYRGECSHPVFVALHSTIQKFAIPEQPFADLISAFEQDQHITEYDTFDQLQDYCTRSANPVGRIVLHLVQSYNGENAAWSDSICTGLQLANFWQDVARDYEIGRVYLPAEDRQRYGYRDEDLQNRRFNAEFRELMRFEVERAHELLEAGRPLVAKMPGRIKFDIELFIEGGLEILSAIERIDYNVWQQRPVVRRAKLLRTMFFRWLRRGFR